MERRKMNPKEAMPGKEESRHLSVQVGYLGLGLVRKARVPTPRTWLSFGPGSRERRKLHTAANTVRAPRAQPPTRSRTCRR